MSEVNSNPTTEGGDVVNKELTVLTAKAGPIEIGGESLTISPLKIGQLVDFAEAVTPIYPQVLAMVQAKKVDISAALSGIGPQLMVCAAIATSTPLSWVKGLEVDEFVRLISKVFLVNADFFLKRLPEMIDQLNASAEALKAPVGDGSFST